MSVQTFWPYIMPFPIKYCKNIHKSTENNLKFISYSHWLLNAGFNRTFYVNIKQHLAGKTILCSWVVAKAPSLQGHPFFTTIVCWILKWRSYQVLNYLSHKKISLRVLVPMLHNNWLPIIRHCNNMWFSIHIPIAERKLLLVISL